MLSKIRIPEPPRYKLNKAVDRKICVTGSVDGVMMAAANVHITSTYFDAVNISFPVTMPNSPKATWIAGTWKAKPVENSNMETKSKYWLKDQKGSTISEPYEIKKFKAAGTRKKYEKNNPRKKSIPDPKLIGKIMLRSFCVSPGIKYNNNWKSIKGLLIKIPQKMEIFTDAKKYSPGENWRNFTPRDGAWNNFTISFTFTKQRIVEIIKTIKQKNNLCKNSSMCSEIAISLLAVIFVFIEEGFFRWVWNKDRSV